MRGRREMAKSNLEKVQSVVDKLGPGYRVYKGYSGRGMFGRTCLGITGPSLQEMLAATKRFGKASYDNMGLNMIVYWPHME
jgi:hypothetical protein